MSYPLLKRRKGDTIRLKQPLHLNAAFTTGGLGKTSTVPKNKRRDTTTKAEMGQEDDAFAAGFSPYLLLLSTSSKAETLIADLMNGDLPLMA